MSDRFRRGALAGLLLVGCRPGSEPRPSARVELRKVSGSSIELVPTQGQQPYCLVFSTSEHGTVRQLTMTRENRSVPCEAGKPIMGTSFKIPVEEGKVRLTLFLSSQKLSAASVAQQVLDNKDKPRWSPIDLRLPGNVFAQVLEFTPEEELPSSLGKVIEADAGGE